MIFKGVYTAIITPFKEGKIDFDVYYNLLKRQIEGGVSGIVPCGTTGESATLSYEEHREMIKKTIEFVSEIKKELGIEREVGIIAGAGSNSTDEAISLARYAEEVGADAGLLITPYYNKPTQEGLVAHYKRIADSTSLRMVVYNVPGRTGVNLLPETVKRLAEIPNVVALKEASGNLIQITDIVRLVGDKISVLSGDDIQLHPIISVGAVGVISVVSNVVPDIMSKYFSLIDDNNWEEARKLFLDVIYPLARAMFIETNPVPVKQALEFMGYASSEVRLPLVRMKEENKERLRKIMEEVGVL